MPKKLVNVREQLLAKARRLLGEEGYSACSVRRLSGECGVAAGTVYNYFKSKDEIIACVIMEDWHGALAAFETDAQDAESVTDGIAGMYRTLSGFIGKYAPVWNQYAACGGSDHVKALHHRRLRDQIAGSMAALMRRCGDDGELTDLAPLLAETLLAAALQPDIGERPLRLLMSRLESGAAPGK